MTKLIIVSILAFAVWLVAEIPLVRELSRRFRTGPRTLPVFLALCALLEMTALVWRIAGLLQPDDPFVMDWPTVGGALLVAFVPFGAMLAIAAIGLALVSLAGLAGVVLHGLSEGAVFRSSDLASLPLFPFFLLPAAILFLLSPFLRSRLLRRAPVRHPRLLAALALFTAYLPFLPAIVAFRLLQPTGP